MVHKRNQTLIHLNVLLFYLDLSFSWKSIAKKRGNKLMEVIGLSLKTGKSEWMRPSPLPHPLPLPPLSDTMECKMIHICETINIHRERLRVEAWMKVIPPRWQRAGPCSGAWRWPWSGCPPRVRCLCNRPLQYLTFVSNQVLKRPLLSVSTIPLTELIWTFLLYVIYSLNHFKLRVNV